MTAPATPEVLLRPQLAPQSTTRAPDRREWLEPDGLGGFASGTVSGPRTRRYHALLLHANPAGRWVLVNGIEVWAATPSGRYPLTTEKYVSGVLHPDGWRRLVRFEREPWPAWSFRLEDGTEIEAELLVPHQTPLVAMRWRLARKVEGVSIEVRPFLSGRDYHSTHRENRDFAWETSQEGTEERRLVRWRPYSGVPGVAAHSNGLYLHEPHWYRSFLYDEEAARGLDAVEDLASPGSFRFNLSREEGQLVFAVDGHPAAARALSAAPGCGPGSGQGSGLGNLFEAERKRRSAFPTPLHRAAGAYVARRVQGEGLTIIAGYPWFTDWGRDTFIALRGLCLATGRLKEAGEILRSWAGSVSEGMLPNRFPDGAGQPEFNSVDASLWFVVAVHDYLEARAASAPAGKAPPEERRELVAAVEAILAGFEKGARHRIVLEMDGLLSAGEAGVQLTWMDARVGNWVVTPRIGKPVEVEALWLNALEIGAALTEDRRLAERWKSIRERGTRSFRERFWHDPEKRLHDVVDPDHTPGLVDPIFRPNQIFAVGGLPYPILEGERARAVVDAVEARLLTPRGLRTLDPRDPRYTPRYQGGVKERDGAYHQGTVWPWLLGPFVEAWVRVRGGGEAVKAEARRRFLDPLLEGLEEAGLGHLPEIADGDPPHTARGCPFQAWSLGEALRLSLVVLTPRKEGA